MIIYSWMCFIIDFIDSTVPCCSSENENSLDEDVNVIEQGIFVIRPQNILNQTYPLSVLLLCIPEVYPSVRLLRSKIRPSKTMLC